MSLELRLACGTCLTDAGGSYCTSLCPLIPISNAFAPHFLYSNTQFPFCCCFAFLSLAFPSYPTLPLFLRCFMYNQHHIPSNAQKFGGGGGSKRQEAKPLQLQLGFTEAMK